jgi:hypothetical protein
VRTWPAPAVLAVALGLAGCASTAMTAAEVRVPVLLGPVPCIGCAAEKRQPAAMPVAHLGARDSPFMLFIPILPQGATYSDDRHGGVSADRLLFGTSCLHDLQLANLRARAWMLSLPIFFYLVDTSVEADGTEVVVPGASCASP